MYIVSLIIVATWPLSGYAVAIGVLAVIAWVFLKRRTDVAIPPKSMDPNAHFEQGVAHAEQGEFGLASGAKGPFSWGFIGMLLLLLPRLVVAPLLLLGKRHRLGRAAKRWDEAIHQMVLRLEERAD